MQFLEVCSILLCLALHKLNRSCMILARLKGLCFLFLVFYLSIMQNVLGQGASTAYIVDEGFTGSVSAVNAGFTLTGVSAITSNGNFGRNSPSLKFSANTDKIEYAWSEQFLTMFLSYMLEMEVQEVPSLCKSHLMAQHGLRLVQWQQM